MGIDLLLDCSIAEKEHLSSGPRPLRMRLIDVDEKDLNIGDVFNVIDPDAFCKHRGIERVEE